MEYFVDLLDLFAIRQGMRDIFYDVYAKRKKDQYRKDQSRKCKKQGLSPVKEMI